MPYKLSKLQVTNFRNLDNSVLDFNQNINCIFGENGNGKTNILEAIYFLINRKSFRKNTSFPQMISIESEQPEIIFSSLFQDNFNQYTYSGKVSLDSNTWYFNNKAEKKKIGLETVFINPFDSYAFHNVPAFRREWIDTHISKINKKYKTILNKYNQSLRFRNTLLSKRPDKYIDQVKVIDIQIAEYSYFISQQRVEFLKEIKDYCEKTFKVIFHESHELEIRLESKFNLLDVKQIHEFYKENLEKDIIIGKTRYGVHRDDYVFHFDGYNSYEFCSLGQQKMCFLILIFAYIELFRYKFNSYPIVLIDDVSGELDGRRWKNLIGYLKDKDFQVFITTANSLFREELERIESSNKIFVDNGEIKNI
jgi:DNA replication and repair protein RecF